MFDISKRGGGRDARAGVDDELEKDRFSTPRPAAEPSTPTTSAARVRDAAVIGASIHIDGDLRGEEDLLIEGNVTGTIHLRDNSLTVGGSGKIKADVYAHSIFVDGSVEGDLYGSERVAIRKSGSVKGNIVSPRVSLDDGGRFKGAVEMDQQAVDASFGRTGGRAEGAGSKPERPAAPAPATARGGGESKTSPDTVGGAASKSKEGERRAASSGVSGS